MPNIIKLYLKIKQRNFFSCTKKTMKPFYSKLTILEVKLIIKNGSESD